MLHYLLTATMLLASVPADSAQRMQTPPHGANRAAPIPTYAAGTFAPHTGVQAAQEQPPEQPSVTVPTPPSKPEPELPEIITLRRENLRLKRRITELEAQILQMRIIFTNQELSNETQELIKSLEEAAPDGYIVDRDTLTLVPKNKD